MTNIAIAKYSNLVLFTLCCCGSFSCLNKNLAIDSRGYLFTNSHHALTAGWLDASQRSRDGPS